MAAQRTQRRDFDKAIRLDLDLKPRQHLTFVSFVQPLCPLCSFFHGDTCKFGMTHV